MTRWRKVKPVALFELLSTVRSKGWLISTFGMPAFLMLYGGIVSIPLLLEAQKEKEVAVYGLVDDAGVVQLESDVSIRAFEIPAEIRSALGASEQAGALERQVAWFQNVVFRSFPAEDPARAALTAGTIRGYFRIPQDYLETGVIESYSSEALAIKGADTRRALGRLLVERLVRGKLADDVAARVSEPISDTRAWIVTQTGEVKKTENAAKIVRVVVPLAFSILLLLSILMSAGGLIQATAVEKENKVIEVLLSSANPDEILIGKLLGQGGAGMLQMTVWFGMAAVAGVFFTGALASIGIEPPWLGMAAAILFFPLAYFFFGSLMLGTGSIGSNQREANQWGMMWSLLAVVPMIMLETMIGDPHGSVARTLTWIPFAAPTAVVLRLSLAPAGVAWWEIVGSILVLILSIWFAIRVGARLFRVGIMLTGARPKLREILRQARL